MTRFIHELPAHPARTLLLPLEVMVQLGYDPQECLRGTGVHSHQLQDPNARISLHQELRFYFFDQLIRHRARFERLRRVGQAITPARWRWYMAFEFEKR